MSNRDIQTRSLLLAASIAPPISFLKLFLVFLSGGLFFSMALCGVAACYSLGMNNVSKILEILAIVLQRVWITFSLGMGYTRLALLGEEQESFLVGPKKRPSFKWRHGWKTLKEQLEATRRTAAQGVKALRQEATLYTAAVGPPGLIPLQHIVDRLMPHSLASMLEDSFRDSLERMPSQKTIRKMKLTSFNGGTRAPMLEAARVFDVDGAIAFDYDVKWLSEIEATVELSTFGGIARVPISLRDFSFEGVVRVILAPLSKKAPGYGATLISLPAPPKMNVNVKVLGSEVTRLPFLRAEITSAMQKAITGELLWPRRAVHPTMTETGDPLLNPMEIKALEKSDPLLEAERSIASKQPALFQHVTESVRSTRDSESVNRQKEQGGVKATRPEPKAATVSPDDLSKVHFKLHHKDRQPNVQNGILWNSLKLRFKSSESHRKGLSHRCKSLQGVPNRNWALQDAT